MTSPIIEKSLRHYLLESTGLTNRIGRHIYAARIPQAARPSIAILIRRLATERYYNLADEYECVSPRITVDIFGRGPGAELAVLEVAELIRLRITSQSGAWGSPLNATQVFSCTIERENTVPPMQPVDGSDNWVARHQMELLICHDQD